MNGIEDIMNSLEGMRPAKPRASLYAQIEQRVVKGYVAARIVPLGRVSLAAACILLLVLVNVLLVSNQQGQAAQAQDPLQTVANYYGLNDNMEVGL